MHEKEPCQYHDTLEYKTNLVMKLMGANLFGVVVIASMVAWSVAKGMPEMETRLIAQINTLAQRVAKLESWQRSVELNELAMARERR